MDNTFFLVDPFQRNNPENLSKTWKKSMKILKIGKICNFCHIRSHFETFSFRTLQLSVYKRQLDNQPFPRSPLKTFQCTNSVKHLRKSVKTSKVENFGFFCHFRCQCETFSFRTMQLFRSLKVTGRPTFPLLFLDNIPIHEVCRTLAKNA